MTHKGTIGRVALVDELPVPFVLLSPQVTYYRVQDGGVIDRRYLRYYFESREFQEVFEAWADSGSTRAYLSITSQLDLPVALRNIDEQRSIADLLGTLDDKIDLNRRMNETLEAIASAYFRAWFVDFDPVIAKAAGRDPVGLDAATAALFPSAFAQSTLGPIPHGWRVMSVSEIIALNPPRMLPSGAVAPYLGMSNMPTHGHAALAWEDRPVSSGMRFTHGDTLLARITPCLENGKTAFVDFLSEGEIGWGSTEYIVFRPRPPVYLHGNDFRYRGEIGTPPRVLCMSAKFSRV